MRPYILAGSALAFALAGAAAAQTMNHSKMAHGTMAMNAAPGDAAAALPTPDFINTAAKSDAFEIAEGRLAGVQAKNKSLQNFGRMMVTEHSKTTGILKKTVMEKGLPAPDPTLTADQQAKVDALRGLHGAEFDRAYVSQQMDAHHMALDVMANYAKGGSDPALKTVARNTVPIVQGHLNSLTTLQAKVNGAS